MCTHTHTHGTHTYTCAHTHTHTHMHARTHTRTHGTHTYTHTHVHTYTHTHVHTHTHTHTHVMSNSPLPSCDKHSPSGYGKSSEVSMCPVNAFITNDPLRLNSAEAYDLWPVPRAAPSGPRLCGETVGL